MAKPKTNVCNGSKLHCKNCGGIIPPNICHTNGVMSHHRHFGGNFPRNIGWDKLIGGFVPPIRKLWWDNPTEFGHNNAGNRAREACAIT